MIELSQFSCSFISIHTSGYPSYSKMTVSLCYLFVTVEVALQSLPGSAKSSTVGTLDLDPS